MGLSDPTLLLQLWRLWTLAVSTWLTGSSWQNYIQTGQIKVAWLYDMGCPVSWWCHGNETFCAVMALGGFPRKRAIMPFYPSALRAGGVLSSRSGRAGWRAGGWAGGCQTCGTHISVTAWWIFSVRSSMELSRPVVVHCHAHTPICPIWACPWAKNLSNLPQIGSRLCGSHISETAGWIYPI